MRDVKSNSNFYGVGGTISQNGLITNQAATIPNLNLNFDAKYSTINGAIQIEATATDTSGLDRAISIYYALPIDATVLSGLVYKIYVVGVVLG